MLHKTSLLIFAILISMGAFADEQTSASRICNKAREYGYQTKNALNGVYGTQRKYDLGCLYLGLFAANMEELRAVFIANKDFSKDVFNEAHDLYLRVMNLTPYCGMNVIFSRYTETMPIRRHDATELLRQLNEIMPRSDELQVAVDRLTK